MDQSTQAEVQRLLHSAMEPLPRFLGAQQQLQQHQLQQPAQLQFLQERISAALPAVQSITLEF
jgi:hypothetical protein